MENTHTAWAWETEVKLPCTLEELPTPCLLIDEEVVKRNCQNMIEKCRKAGVKLRPHVKTHKTVEITRMQFDDAGSGICVGAIASTLPEVRLLASAAISDITYGVPIGDASKLKHLAAVLDAFPAVSTIGIFIDSETSLAAVEAFSVAGKDAPRWAAFLKIDVGYHRAGVDVTTVTGADAAINLAKRMVSSPAITFRGVYCHSGNAYAAGNAEEARTMARNECSAARSFLNQLVASAGIDPATAANLAVSVGSTPACACADVFEGATEVHPGNYVFFDRQQVAAGACGDGDIAATVLTRVIGHYAAHILCDAGALALSKDTAPQGDGYGAVLGHPGLRVAAVSQEVGRIVRVDTGSSGSAGGGAGQWDQYPIGTLLRIVPNHSCLTAACHRSAIVVRGGVPVAQWVPCSGW